MASSESCQIFSALDPAKKQRRQGAISRSAVREFVVNESCGQEAFAFTAGDEKSEARRERLADFAIVGEADGDGRAVGDGGELG